MDTNLSRNQKDRWTKAAAPACLHTPTCSSWPPAADHARPLAAWCKQSFILPVRSSPRAEHTTRLPLKRIASYRASRPQSGPVGCSSASFQTLPCESVWYGRCKMAVKFKTKIVLRVISQVQPKESLTIQPNDRVRARYCHLWYQLIIRQSRLQYTITIIVTVVTASASFFLTRLIERRDLVVL